MTEHARGPKGYHHKWMAEDKKTDAVDVGDEFDPQCHEVSVAGIALYAPSHAKWPITATCKPKSPLPSEMSAYTQWLKHICNCADACPYRTKPVWKPKVDSGAGGNVMSLHGFAKLFPKCISIIGKPLGLHPSDSLQWIYHPPTWCPRHYHWMETQRSLPPICTTHMMVCSRHPWPCHT